MTDKELKKLSRAELLEMLLEQTRRVEQLKKELEEKNAMLEEKKLMIEDAGNLAQAALALNKVFEAAQAAADQYLYNVKLRTEAEKEQ